jgi:tRNA threonylcarbamoyladenosine biosynthesis protein TsaE
MTHANDHITLPLPDEAATQALGASLAHALAPGLKVYLSGDLGAGKTTLVRALLRACGYAGKVKSPTYTLVEPYTVSNLHLYHFDLYRMTSPEEWSMSGFREIFDEAAICLVEWPERAAGELPEPDLAIALQIAESSRAAYIVAHSERGRTWLRSLQTSR